MQMPKPLALNILIVPLHAPIHCPCLYFNELNYSYAAPSDVHGDDAHDVFQTIGPIVLITPAALDPKTRKPSALFRPAEIDATTRTNFTVDDTIRRSVSPRQTTACVKQQAVQPPRVRPRSIVFISATPGGGASKMTR
jgi:hypothetical protein